MASETWPVHAMYRENWINEWIEGSKDPPYQGDTRQPVRENMMKRLRENLRTRRPPPLWLFPALDEECEPSGTIRYDCGIQYLI